MDDLNWYAIKVFWRRTARIKEVLDGLGMEYYAQKVVPSYVFIYTDEASAKRLAHNQFGFIYLYAERKFGYRFIVFPYIDFVCVDVIDVA